MIYSNHTLKLANVSYRYPGAESDALKNLSLTIPANSFTAVVGTSGCGKSTLLKLVAGLLKSSGGSIRFGPSNSPKQPAAVKANPAEGRFRRSLSAENLLQESTAWQPQGDLLLDWKNVLDNATLGARLTGVSRSEAETEALALLAVFGLKDTEQFWPTQLSGGMRQRVSLLRTFLMPKDVLLLDEPFSALDAITRETLREWLENVWLQDRRTTIFVTHDIRQALLLADQVVVLSNKNIAPHIEQLSWERPRTKGIQLDSKFVELVTSIESRCK